MPKRTNEFQQLVVLIQTQLSERATVTESRLMRDKLTGADVEVDVTVETSVNGVDICLGIECTAKKRKATVEWVREMHAKHSMLPSTRPC